MLPKTWDLQTVFLLEKSASLVVERSLLSGEVPLLVTELQLFSKALSPFFTQFSIHDPRTPNIFASMLLEPTSTDTLNT